MCYSISTQSPTTLRLSKPGLRVFFFFFEIRLFGGPWKSHVRRRWSTTQCGRSTNRSDGDDGGGGGGTQDVEADDDGTTAVMDCPRAG